MKYIFFFAILFSQVLFAEVPTTREYLGSSSMSGASWRRKVGAIIPLTKACSKEEYALLANQAIADGLEKCEADGSSSCRVMKSTDGGTRGDLGCGAHVKVIGTLSAEKVRQLEQEEQERIAIEKAEREQMMVTVNEHAKAKELKQEQTRRASVNPIFLNEDAVNDVTQLQKLLSENSQNRILVNILSEREANPCGLCIVSNDVIEGSVAQLNSDGIKIIDVRTSANSEILHQLNVSGYPTYLVFENGVEVGRQRGVLSTRQMMEFLRQ